MEREPLITLSLSGTAVSALATDAWLAATPFEMRWIYEPQEASVFNPDLVYSQGTLVELSGHPLPASYRRVARICLDPRTGEANYLSLDTDPDSRGIPKSLAAFDEVIRSVDSKKDSDAAVLEVVKRMIAADAMAPGQET